MSLLYDSPRSAESVFEDVLRQSGAYAAEFRNEHAELMKMREDSPYAAVIVVVCMDERCCSFAQDTGGVPGYYEFMRTKGARIEMSNHQVTDTIGDVIRAGSEKPILMIFTVHYSGSEPTQGCAGWDGNSEAAFDHQHRVAEAFRRNYPEKVHTAVLGYDTDCGSLSIEMVSRDGQNEDDKTPKPDGSPLEVVRAKHVDVCCVKTIVAELPEQDESGLMDFCKGALRCNLVGRNSRFAFAAENAAYSVSKELERMFGVNAAHVARSMREPSSDLYRCMKHSATQLYAGSGFEFVKRSGEAVYVGLHSSTFIADVTLGIEKIIIPAASRFEGSAVLIVNRQYNPKLSGEQHQAIEWVHAVVEDIACLFKAEIDSGELRIMESVSTHAEGMQTICIY